MARLVNLAKGVKNAKMFKMANLAGGGKNDQNVHKGQTGPYSQKSHTRQENQNGKDSKNGQIGKRARMGNRAKMAKQP